MKTFCKKTLSVLLSVVMLLSVCAVCAFAADDAAETPVIFVDGISSSDIVNTQTGETVFPPSANAIIGGVKNAVLPLVSAIADKDYSELAGPVSEAVVKIFEGASCDENGRPVYPTASEYTKPAADNLTDSQIALERIGLETDELIWFSYDWRLDMQTLASQLHDFIEYVRESTGSDKVSLVGFSMGTCVTMTYLHEYDYEYVEDVVLLAGGFNGVSTCGEPFSGHLGFDAEAMVRFLYTILGEDFGDYILKAVVDAVYQSGVLTNVLDFADELCDAILDDVYEYAFKETFARMPGFWSLIPYDMYDEAKALLIGDNVTDEYVAMIDYYHYEIQGNNRAIIDGALESGINFAIVAKYGSTVPPCIESINNIGDSVIDTQFESFGATCSTANTTLGADYVQAIDDGHNHISADNLIDASTCAYPEYTWFIKGLAHAEHTDGEIALLKFLMDSETQPTVHDDAAYSQFLIADGDTLVPLTQENNHDAYGEVTAPETGFFAKIIHVIKLLLEAIKALFKGLL